MPAAPLEEFVERLLRLIGSVAEKPYVEVELVDGARLAVESIEAEPGFGFVTLRPHPTGEPPEAVVVPVGSLRRIDISGAAEDGAPLGFSLPQSS